MQSYNISQNVSKRHGVLVFLKNAANPVVFYVDKPQEFYNEIQAIMKQASSAGKLIERVGNGPLIKMTLFDNQIAGVALQEEAYVNQ